MKINNKELNQYNVQGIYMSWTGLMNINTNMFAPDSSYLPVMGTLQLSAQSRTLIVDFINEEDVSNFTSELCNESLLDIDDGYEYLIWLNGTPEITQDGYGAYTVSYPLLVIKRKSLITKTLSNNKIVIEGNIQAEIRMKITSTKVIKDLIVDSYKIPSMKADTLIIDGIDKKVYYKSNPDVSAFDDVEMTEFPKLKSGENVINISDSTVTVVIEYYPIFM